MLQAHAAPSRRPGPGRRLQTAAAALAATVVALGTAPPALAATAPATDRVLLASDDGHAPAGAVDEGAASASGKISLRVYLQVRDPAGLRTLARQVSTPGNPHYRHFLTPARFRSAYAPTARQRAAVSSWLRSCGLDTNGGTDHYIAASGDPAAVECAVGARLHRYRWQGRSLRALAGPARIPRSVAPDVLSMSGLSSLTPAVRPAGGRSATVTPASSATCSTSYGANPATALPPAYGTTQPYQVCGYLPGQLRGAYGVTPSGLTGAGTKVAVIGAYASTTVASDAQTYASRHGEQTWASGQFTQDVPDGLPAQPMDWGMEEIMDVEAVHAIAPSADVEYVAAADATDASFLDAVSRVVDARLADVVSDSWVIGADTGVPSGTVSAFDQLFQQGAVEGVGFVFASGDHGSQAASQDGNGSPVTATEFPASDPWVTAVGGTSLAVDADGRYQWETGWESDYAALSADGTGWETLPGSYAGGSGGGPSAVFTRPSYQRHLIPASAFTGNGTLRRVVPDVAMDADPVTGMLVGQTYTLPNGAGGYVEYASGGTSLAAPLYAGIQALAQQRAGRPLGFANPAIYQAAENGAFRDVTDRPAGAPRPPAAVHTELTADATGTVTTSYVLATFGRSQDAGLATTPAYDDVTGVGTPTAAYFNHIR
ncbi:S53 family peptidase [Streptomyces cellulosae]|uniref:S53 family peptidase n=1 Tax=Streptomyces cellulosae TaxID=1968 RepID=UPI00068EF576|nr:S53 family peptidase [Streptomyces cellulosae]